MSALPTRLHPSEGMSMATYVLIHGAGDVGWYWHLVEAELRRRGNDVVPRIFRATTIRRDSPSTRIP
jgi:hypothetical protein